MGNSRFYIENNSSSTVYFSAFHLNCNGTPWLDGSPLCTTQTVVPGAVQSCDISNWKADADFSLSVFEHIKAMAAESTVAVLYRNAEPASLSILQAIAEQYWNGTVEATEQQIAGVISALSQASAENFASVLQKLGSTPEGLGSTMKRVGIRTAVLCTEALMDALLCDWKFILTNATARVWQPCAAIVDIQTGSTIYTVTDTALANTGIAPCEHSGWLQRDTDHISVWWSSSGVEGIPGFSSAPIQG